MQLMYEIPDSFWSLFRSVNRAAYMEALLILNEEYQYNNYFLSRDVCIQILGDFYAKKRVALAREDNENDQEASEPPRVPDPELAHPHGLAAAAGGL